MLRERREADLNALLTTCREAADLYRDEAKATRSAQTAALFRELAGRRSARADELEGAIRELGALPEGTEQDRETARRLLDRFRAELADSDEPLLLARARLEAHIEDLIDHAETDPLPEGAQRLLVRLREDVDRARGQLAKRIRADDNRG